LLAVGVEPGTGCAVISPCYQVPELLQGLVSVSLRVEMDSSSCGVLYRLSPGGALMAWFEGRADGRVSHGAEYEYRWLAFGH